MTKVKMQLKSIAKNLAALSKKVESLSGQLAKTAPAKKAKAAPKKAKKVKKAKPVKKAAAAKKAKTAKKAPAKKAKVDKGATVLASVSGAINKSKKGISIAQLKEKTKLNPRQLSNALYKLTKKGKDPGQAVGYLIDGSMVVVSNADGLVGKEVDVLVDSIIPSSGGKMIFARVSPLSD